MLGILPKPPPPRLWPGSTGAPPLKVVRGTIFGMRVWIGGRGPGLFTAVAVAVTGAAVAANDDDDDGVNPAAAAAANDDGDEDDDDEDDDEGTAAAANEDDEDDDEGAAVGVGIDADCKTRVDELGSEPGIDPFPVGGAGTFTLMTTIGTDVATVENAALAAAKGPYDAPFIIPLNFLIIFVSSSKSPSFKNSFPCAAWLR